MWFSKSVRVEIRRIGVLGKKSAAGFVNLVFLDTSRLDTPLFDVRGAKKFGTLHEFACHPCAGAMLIFSVSFQF